MGLLGGLGGEQWLSACPSAGENGGGALFVVRREEKGQQCPCRRQWGERVNRAGAATDLGFEAKGGEKGVGRGR